jgi:hypothetical protein
MKKKILILVLTVAGISVFANPTFITDPRAEQVFKKQFFGASHVKWTKAESGYLRATFTWAGHRTIAYFSPNGEFAGSVRNLLFNQLPLTVMRAVDNQFKNNIVIEIREITNDDGTHYAIQLEQKNKKLKVKINSAGEILQQEKVKK